MRTGWEAHCFGSNGDGYFKHGEVDASPVKAYASQLLGQGSNFSGNEQATDTGGFRLAEVKGRSFRPSW